MGMVKFEAEKKAYQQLLDLVINGNLSITEHYQALIKMRTLEELISAQEDKIVVIVSTEKTYDETQTEDVPQAVSPVVKDYPEIINADQLEKIVNSGEPCCKHSEGSHGKKGCRYCDCTEPRVYE